MNEQLVELGASRLEEVVPKAYVKYAIASTLASRIVYQEGVDFVEQHRSDDRLAALAFDFLRAQNAVADIVELMENLDWDGAAKANSSNSTEEQTRLSKEIAMRIIRDGGIRAYLGNQVK